MSTHPDPSPAPAGRAFRVAVLGSGQGSNCLALMQAEREGRLGRARIVVVISDRPQAGILGHAKDHGIPGLFLDPAPFRTKLEGPAEQNYIACLSEHRPDLIVLAGFMRVIKAQFLQTFAGRIINLHPSLLPSFPGLDGIGQAWRHGVRIAGCTVHRVTAGVDTGPILDQAAIRREDSDSEKDFADKIHAAEHALLPSVVARLSLASPVVKQ